MAGSPLRILVVGAGLAGLAAARALRLAGFRPDVVEQLPASDVDPAGIYLAGNAARALRQLGLADPVRPLGRVLTLQRFHDAGGRLLCEIDLVRRWAGVGECRALPRADLHRVLLTAVGGEVRHGTGLERLDLGPDAVRATFAGGGTREYDVVVGADGPNSTVRVLAGLDADVRSVDQVVYRTVVSDGPKINEWTALLGRRAGFVAIPMYAGRLYCYAEEASSTPPAEPLARLREVFGEYGGPVPAVLENITSVDVAVPVEVELPRWSAGRVVLVGDAAHATAPALLQGAAMAFEDALVLAEALRQGGTPGAALAEYERRRRPRVSWVRQRTRDRERTRDAPPALRDLLLRGRGRRIFQRYDRLLIEPT